jgi:hypothetical protein
VHRTLSLMEKQKYLQPYLSDTVESLVKYLNSQYVSIKDISKGFSNQVG